MTKLSDDILDAICGADECSGKDAQLTEWAERARGLERVVEMLTKVADEADKEFPPRVTLTSGCALFKAAMSAGQYAMTDSVDSPQAPLK